MTESLTLAGSGGSQTLREFNAVMEETRRSIRDIGASSQTLSGFRMQMALTRGEMEKAGRDGLKPLTRSLTDLVSGSRDARTALRGLAKELIDSFADSLEQPGGKPSSGASGLFSVLGGIFGGFRAAGGPVSPGKAFVVGERGPELFFPGRAGQILPSPGRAAAAPVQITIHNNSDSTVRTQTREQPGGGREIEVFIDRTIAAAIMEGGKTRQALRSAFGLSPVLAGR